MSVGIPGLGVVEDAIDAAEELRLLRVIELAPWSDELRRRVQHYGWRYDYQGRAAAAPLGALPEWAAALAERLAAEGTFLRVPDQVIVNEYLPGQGIAAHSDSAAFGEVVASLSLGSAVTMTLTPSGGGDAREVRLARRSLLVLAGKSRSHFKHGIPPRKSDDVAGVRVPRERRVSVTFRTLAQLDAKALDPDFPSLEHHARLLERRIAKLDAPLRRGLRRLATEPLPAGADLVQLEFFEDRQSDSFPIEVLCKRKSDGVDHYSAGQSHDPNRSALAFIPLVSEPLSDGSLSRYIDPGDFDEVINACDVHRHDRLSEWLVSAWDEELGAGFPIPAFFLRMGDDVEGEVWDLRRRCKCPWDAMYEK